MTHSISSSLKGKSYQTILSRRILNDRWLYFMLLPGILYFLIFKYAPTFGLVMVFQDYQPFLGFIKSQWVGFAHFQRFFNEPSFWMLLKNTLIIGIYNLFFFFPLPIIISLMLNEVRMRFVKRTIQTLIYIPHFLSWVVIAAVTYTFLTTEGGIVNNVIISFGGEKINPLLSAAWFRPMIILQVIWKEVGWGTIIQKLGLIIKPG